ncbi:glyoxalase family protein [Leptodontidium sp. 2 PMI_412]|nr:glyoxalase family protein [Leptodontidium sp. 2 PMI_412]
MASKDITKGFRMTHVGLRVANLEKSVNFYSGMFGMKELGRMPLDTVTIVFLGYADSAASDIPLFAREGVLELNANKTMETSNNHPDSHFVKLAFSVPNMDKAMEYLASHDIRILKYAGTADGSEVVCSFLGCETPDKGYDKGLWEAVVAVPFVQDPDGYLIEIIPY